ncbi:protein lin-54 homolog isoform X2 [Varroa jacobsoni]|uniref:CRC domain-containing protein n=1 Tax=Varroa destructor TaxID=109461 RepID=A0A7M7JQF7_VARDE|nr:protein lin-54 homolog isoform X2 [Varroa destructor]XP_022708389.1 protein lin-54 homolog isoform X2 [Varroa jacobsoni]
MEAEPETEFTYEIAEDVGDGQAVELTDGGAGGAGEDEGEYIEVQADEHGNLIRDEDGNLIQYVPIDSGNDTTSHHEDPTQHHEVHEVHEVDETEDHSDHTVHAVGPGQRVQQIVDENGQVHHVLVQDDVDPDTEGTGLVEATGAVMEGAEDEEAIVVEGDGGVVEGEELDGQLIEGEDGQVVLMEHSDGAVLLQQHEDADAEVEEVDATVGGITRTASHTGPQMVYVVQTGGAVGQSGEQIHHIQARQPPQQVQHHHHIQQVQVQPQQVQVSQGSVSLGQQSSKSKIVWITKPGGQGNQQLVTSQAAPAVQATHTVQATQPPRLIQIGGQTLLVQSPSSYATTTTPANNQDTVNAIQTQQQKVVLRAPPQQQHQMQQTQQQIHHHIGTQQKQVIYMKPTIGPDGKTQLMEVFQNPPQQTTLPSPQTTTVQVTRSPQKIAPRVTTTLQQQIYKPQTTQVISPHQQLVTVQQAAVGTATPQFVVVKSSAQGQHTFALQAQQQAAHDSDYEYERPLAHASTKKPCNCTKSQCLKLYCDCFANGEFCQNCNCVQCYNNLMHEEERSLAVKLCLERNPNAFHPKIGKYKPGDKERRHTKGCNCKRSGCLKNYCECYEARILCSAVCRCVGCHNIEANMDAETLLTIKQDLKYPQPKSKLDDLLKSLAGVGEPEKLPTARSPPPPPELHISAELVDATCECLVARAAEVCKQEDAEKAILQEFGHCLAAIVDAASVRATTQRKQHGTASK